MKKQLKTQPKFNLKADSVTRNKRKVPFQLFLSHLKSPSRQSPRITFISSIIFKYFSLSRNKQNLFAKQLKTQPYFFSRYREICCYFFHLRKKKQFNSTFSHLQLPYFFVLFLQQISSKEILHLLCPVLLLHTLKPILIGFLVPRASTKLILSRFPMASLLKPNSQFSVDSPPHHHSFQF